MRCFLLAAALIAFVAGVAVEDVKSSDKKTRKHHAKHTHHGTHHHHHHHHGKHHHHEKHNVDHVKTNETKKIDPALVKDFATAMKGMDSAPSAKKAVPVNATKPMSHLVSKGAEKKATAKSKESEDTTIVKKMKALEEKLEKKKVDKQGQILVNGPLPADFKERFSQAVAAATGVDAHKVKVIKTKESGSSGIFAVTFMASPHVVSAVEGEAADPDSKLAAGNLHSFLVAKGDDSDEAEDIEEPAPQGKATPVEEKGIDIDTAMPYGDLEPFGREDTAQELTEDSIQQSDGMVDQLERAEVAEEKRAVFRALTRLRGAAITSFDGVARSQTGNIDEYNKIHKWRSTHPLHHLADEESDISKWAFPDNADF